MTFKDGIKFGIGFYLGTTLIKSIDIVLKNVLEKTDFKKNLISKITRLRLKIMNQTN